MFRKEDYHPKWSLISYLVRFVRAKGHCEQCGVKHGLVGFWRYVPAGNRARQGYEIITDHPIVAKYHELRKEHGHRKAVRSIKASYQMHLVKIILTTAHLDHNRQNNRFWNLKSLCQRCHLWHDVAERSTTFKYGRYWKKDQLKINL